MDNETQVGNVVGTGADEVLAGSEDQENAFYYEGGNVTITGYESWETIHFNATYHSGFGDGNDFVVLSDKGTLRIQDARGKIAELYDSNNEIIAHVNMQVAGAEFNGQGEDYTVYNEETGEFESYNYGKFNEPVVVIGSNDGDNTMIAGDGGSTLWGGYGHHNDVMFGGEGQDTFIYHYGEGNDVVSADENDIVNLNGVTFDQIKGISVEDYAVRFVFSDFGSVGVLGRAGEFQIDGVTFTADYENKTLKVKSESSEA